MVEQLTDVDPPNPFLPCHAVAPERWGLVQDPAAPGNPDPATVKLKPTVRESVV
jgi:hypothetical protein